MAVIREVGVDQFLTVVDDAHGGDGVHAQMGTHQQGLGVRIRDAADAAAAVELRQVRLELGTEGSVFNVVDLALEAGGRVIDGHAAPPGAQVGVIVHAKKDIKYTIPLGDCTKKTAHIVFLLFFDCPVSAAAQTAVAE